MASWFKSTSPSTATSASDSSSTAESEPSASNSTDGGDGVTLRTFRLVQDIKTLKVRTGN